MDFTKDIREKIIVATRGLSVYSFTLGVYKLKEGRLQGKCFLSTLYKLSFE